MSKKYLFLALILFLIGTGFLFLQMIRAHGFSAREKPLAIEIWLARHARDLATPTSVKNLKNPLAANPILLAEARDHYADHCATCHGNNGGGNTMYGAGLYPPPPDLRETGTQKLTDGEIFNIIKNGIRFTGMPGFGGGDDDNWKLVSFIRHIPKLSEKEIDLMKEINGGSEEKHENH